MHGTTAYNKQKAEAIKEHRQACAEWLSRNWLAKQCIIDRYESGMTPRQLAHLFIHENGKEQLAEWSKATFDFVNSSGKKVAKRIYNKKSSSGMLSINWLVEVIRSIASYEQHHLEKHLSLPQLERMKYKHADLSKHELQELHDASLRKSAEKTHAIRRGSGCYAPQYKVEYWLQKGARNVEEAKEMLEQFKKSLSPMRVEFWLKRGYNHESARAIITANARKGAAATCESLEGKCKSRLEAKIFDALKGEFPALKTQHRVENSYFDIHLPAKKIIEVNGTFWHADKRLYTDPQHLLHGKTIVEDVWKRDEERAELLSRHGYSLHVMWEMDYIKNPLEELAKAKEFLHGE